MTPQRPHTRLPLRRAPAGSGAKGGIVQAQAVAASSRQSRLHPPDPPVPPPDEFGAWQVAVHWLAREVSRESWDAEIAQLRQRSGFSEDLILDAVFYSEGTLEVMLTKHGLLRLLVAARRVLSQPSPDETARRLSADQAVKRGQRRANVRLGDRRARYILNEAKTHLLGLGWFYTR